MKAEGVARGSNSFSLCIGIMKAETQGLDVRFYTGVTDISQLPSAYKNAETVVRDIKAFSLAKTVDRVLPYGSIMAGDGNRDAPWRKSARSATLSENLSGVINVVAIE